MDISRASGTATSSRRQRQIEDCLYESLLHRPYTSVSVSDLCHQLGLSRKSFYNYYQDKDTCFRAIINRKLQDCMLQLTAGPQEDAYETTASFLSYCREQKVFFDIIVRNNLLTFLMDQTIHYLKVEDQLVIQRLSTPQFQNDPYILSCFVSVNITFVMQWYLQNFDTPLDEMVRKYQRLIHEPLISPREP